MKKLFSAVLAAALAALQTGLMPWAAQAASMDFSAGPEAGEAQAPAPAYFSLAPSGALALPQEALEIPGLGLGAPKNLEAAAAAASLKFPALSKAGAAAPKSSVQGLSAVKASAGKNAAALGSAPVSQRPSGKDIMKAKQRQDAFWDGADTHGNTHGALDVDTPSAGFARRLGRLKTLALKSPLAVAAAAAMPPTPALAAPVKTALPALAHFTPYLPYLKIGAIAAAAYLGNRLAAFVIKRVGQERSWSADKISLYKSVSAISAIALGTVLALPVMGVSLNHIVAGAGIASVLLSIAAGDVINNFFEAGRVLLAQPFLPGGRIKIGGQEYGVRDMGGHDLILANSDGSETIMPYTVLAQSVFTVLQDGGGARRQAFGDLPIAARLKARLKVLSGVVDFLKQDLTKTKASSILAAAAAYLAAAATTYLRLSGPLAWLHSAITPIHAAAIVAATVTTSKIAQPLMARIGKYFPWSRKKTVAVRVLVQAAVWIIGGGLALKSLGTSWSALGTSIGFISLGVGLVAQDILTGFWHWVIIRFGQAIGFNCALKIGDDISSNGVRGVVSDINFYYIVLTLANGQKAYVHYSIVFPFIKFSAAGPNPAAAQGQSDKR